MLTHEVCHCVSPHAWVSGGEGPSPPFVHSTPDFQISSISFNHFCT